jgi:hypothetical protein
MDAQKYQYSGIPTVGYSNTQGQVFMQQAPVPGGPGMSNNKKKRYF